jgi:hypothetical protein
MPTAITRIGSVNDPITVTADPATSAGFSDNSGVGVTMYGDSVSSGPTATTRLLNFCLERAPVHRNRPLHEFLVAHE